MKLSKMKYAYTALKKKTANCTNARVKVIKLEFKNIHIIYNVYKFKNNEELRYFVMMYVTFRAHWNLFISTVDCCMIYFCGDGDAMS